MSDRVFEGPDVSAALAAAGAALGLPPDALRYVVLDPGSPGGRGLKPTPARVAVLVVSAPAASAAALPAPALEPPAERLAEPLAALGRALPGLETRIEDDGETLIVTLAGAGAEAFLVDPDGQGLRALQHLLQRALERDQERRLRVECAGYRERRDERLREQAQALAEAVRRDGAPRELPALNAYERRIVHLALEGLSGVRTFSVGEGAERRLTIAPREE